MPDQDVESEPLFRQFKKRKFLRKRDEVKDKTQEPSVTESHESPLLPTDESDKSNIAELLRGRKTDQSRWHGVKFTNTSKSLGDKQSNISPESSVRHDPEAERFKAITERFVPHTDQPVDVDKHMIDYIESEMAKRRLGTSTMNLETEAHDGYSLDELSQEGSRPFAQRQPVSLGKIQEIDLGQDAMLRNARRTEMAVRKQNGEVVFEEERPPKPRKIRIGRDGKPMRPRRGPKRRNSEDVQRDKLVEEVLRETKLDIYDAPSDESTDKDDLEADERVAEQFKQDFIEAMQSRKRNRTSGQPRQPGVSGGDAPRGPKLGGSRNARAAMREKEMQQKGKK